MTAGVTRNSLNMTMANPLRHQQRKKIRRREEDEGRPYRSPSLEAEQPKESRWTYTRAKMMTKLRLILSNGS